MMLAHTRTYHSGVVVTRFVVALCLCLFGVRENIEDFGTINTKNVGGVSPRYYTAKEQMSLLRDIWFLFQNIPPLNEML